jgi:hypothetical protein
VVWILLAKTTDRGLPPVESKGGEMIFTLKHKEFLDMLKKVGKKQPRQKRGDKDVRIATCAAMVFVEANHTVLGTVAEVVENGQCVLERKPFIAIVATFSAKDQLTVEVNDGRLQIDSFSMAVKECRPHAEVPADYAIHQS